MVSLTVLQLIYVAIAVVLCVVTLTVLSIFKEMRRTVQMERAYEYRKRAMNGLIFEDNWTPEEIDRVFIEKRAQLMEDSIKTKNEQDLEAEQSNYLPY